MKEKKKKTHKQTNKQTTMFSERIQGETRSLSQAWSQGLLGMTTQKRVLFS